MDWSELSNWTEYTKLLAGLFAITEPLSSIPVFLSYGNHLNLKQKRAVALATALAYAIALSVFSLFGMAILSFFGITLAAFKVAGGLLLLMASLEMLKAKAEANTVNADDHKNFSPIAIAITPLTIPLLAGPGAISTIIVFSNLHASVSHSILVIVVILTVAAIIYGLLRSSLSMKKIFNPTTTMIISRVMGLIIASIAIEFIFDGLADHFPQILTIH